VAATCRYYGISRECYYRWLRRYEADGLDGLKDRSAPTTPFTPGHQAEVIEKIVWLRRRYHFDPGQDHLVSGPVPRRHDLHLRGVADLEPLGMNRLPASQRYRRRALRWKRYEKQRPGHQLQVDVKLLGQAGRSGWSSVASRAANRKASVAARRVVEPAR
jgi:Helix-turn-helix domain